MFLALAIFAVGFTSCNGDDDADDIIDPEPEEPTGTIVAVDQTVANNTIVIQTVTVEQDSWLVATKQGDEESRNFITDTVMVEEGVNANVILTLDENADLSTGEAGTEVTILLFADNEDSGTQDELDAEDDEVMMEDGTTARETITVFMEDTTAGFADFDTDGDGNLDQDEFLTSFPNIFEDADADGDGSLSEEEFNQANFGNADADDDGLIDEDEWTAGVTGMFGGYVGEDDFGTFDTNADGELSDEEFGLGFSETDWFGNYDMDDDDLLSDVEWNEGLFGDWDTNDDTFLDETEFGVYNTYTSMW